MDMSNMIRHVGKVANTDQRCVVAFMQIPQRQDHALIIPIDGLPPRFEQAVMDVLKSPDGQQSMPFAAALGRHRMPDTGETIMEALHNQGKLVAMPVSNILMLPTPNQPVKLSFILEQQGKLQHQVPNQWETEKFNPHLNNQHAESSEGVRQIARGLLLEAEMLEAEAKKKREAAYIKDPSLRMPEATQAPVVQSNPWCASTPLESVPMSEIIINSQSEIDKNIERKVFHVEVGEDKAPAVISEDRIAKIEEMLLRLTQITEDKMHEKELPVHAADKLKKSRKEKLGEDASQE